MKDLDFDELDRAVNSLTTSAPAPTEQSPAVPVVASQPTVPAASPLVAKRSTGRFMDVVPPSSNTRVSSSMPERVSRQGATITPAAATPIVPTVATAPASITAAQTNEWPDPIDFHGLDLTDEAPKNEIPASAENEDADIDQINTDITNTLNQTSDESLDSPFISGTKVEKRPLGAFSDGSPTSTPTPEPSAVVETAPAKPIDTPSVDAVPTTPTTPFPAELSDDLLSIESGDTTTQPSEPIAVASVPVAPTVAAPTVVATDNQPTAPSDAAQQYKEQPSSGDQTTGAIYDTDAYHKTLMNQSKKKSSWILVLWITILLAVGAGAGVAVYFLVLPSL